MLVNKNRAPTLLASPNMLSVPTTFVLFTPTTRKITVKGIQTSNKLTTGFNKNNKHINFNLIFLHVNEKGYDGLDRIELVMNRRGGASKMVDLINF